MVRYASEYVASQLATGTNASLTGSILFNVRDYGAKGDGITDDAANIQTAINAAYEANEQTGYDSRVTLYFPPGVYLVKNYLKFLPFINYIGMRATTADSDASFTYPNSRGSIIRAHTSLYNAGNAGTLIYVLTGDITIRDLTFVGTAGINGNPSIGIQWGSSGSGRTQETDGTGQPVAGVDVSHCSFYTFMKAWEVNTLFDTFGFGNRFETNNTHIMLQENPNLATTGNDFELHGTVFYNHTIGVNITGSATKDQRMKLIGAQFFGVTTGQSHISFVNTVCPNSMHLDFIGALFSHSTSSGTNHFLFSGTFDGGELDVNAVGCEFINSTIRLERSGGSASCNNVRFKDCRMKTVTHIWAIASAIRVIANEWDACTITASNTTNVDFMLNEISNTTSFISLTGTDSPDWNVQGNRFKSVTTPLTVNSHPTNGGWIVRDNFGLDTFFVLASGSTSADMIGRNGKFRTNNAVATNLTNITNGVQGQQAVFMFADGNTTVKFDGTGNLRGNAGVNKLMTASNSMICTYDGTVWSCAIG